MSGILLVDKPAGWTSFDVVNYLRKMVAEVEGQRPKQVKVGHTGTLDPFATGLLIVLVGKDFTRRASEFSKLDKTYEVTMELGKISSTGDPEGTITSVSDSKPTRAELEKTFHKLTGQIEQSPPAFSAIKVNGQRAYKLARAGKKVVIEPRKVTIKRLELSRYDYPEVKFTTEVSSGTYIRSLVEDIGNVLDIGAYTTSLRRTMVGEFTLDNAKMPQAITIDNTEPM